MLFEPEAVKKWFQENRKDVSVSDLDALLATPGIMLIAAGAYAAGYLKSKERGGHVPTFAKLEAAKRA